MSNEFFILMRGELVITFIIFFLLFIKLGSGWKNESLLTVVYLLLLGATVTPFFGDQTGQLFAGSFYSSPLLCFQKALLTGSTLLLLVLNHSWLKQQNHLAEFLMLLLSALLGMFLMISSGNLLMFYLSLELATLPVAALANFDLDKKRSGEAAMKMIFSSAFSSGILLFGISLLYGASGVTGFAQLSVAIRAGDAFALLGFVLFLAGLAFKLSVVPFHLWTADVYEGSPVAVSGFLSVISKAAIAFIFITLLYRV
ncbi:MAG: NADH-quinone oxidoreductase subunit N, partial [Chitinophagaceae bacterium]|nr:NADH-quinone oxidoreductase subunit N [Chitinophagaceae bacterium]